MINGLNQGRLPLSFSFALLGQRYVLDSHVFSNVVYDRVAGGRVMRMMPSPLDVAFAALGNNQAASLLAPELESSIRPSPTCTRSQPTRAVRPSEGSCTSAPAMRGSWSS